MSAEIILFTGVYHQHHHKQQGPESQERERLVKESVHRGFPTFPPPVRDHDPSNKDNVVSLVFLRQRVDSRKK